MDLLDDLLYTSFAYLDIYALSRCQRSTRRLNNLVTDHIVRMLPDKCISPGIPGTPCIPVFRQKILYDMSCKDMNDIPYLLGLCTPIFKHLKSERRFNQITWVSLMNAVWGTIWHISSIDNDPQWPSVNAAMKAGINALNRPNYMYLSCPAVDIIRKRADRNLYVNRVLIQLTPHINIACIIDLQAQIVSHNIKRAHIIAASMLLSIDYITCRSVQNSVKDRSNCSISQEELDELKDNPWIQQYIELFKP